MDLATSIAELDTEANALTCAGMTNALAIRDTTERLEKHMKSLPNALGMADFPLRHMFGDGTYIRQVFLPAGTLIVGRRHKQNHYAMVTLGEVSIFCEQEITRFRGPRLWWSPKGTKRVVYAHEDSLFFTIHGTHERDPEKLMQELTE